MGASSEDRRRRRLRWGLYCVLALCYGYFHQGGGWNPNSRFDQIRAIVEDGRPWIDDHLLWRLEQDPHGALRYERVRLSAPALPRPGPAPAAAVGPPWRLPHVNSFDISFSGGHYYPNKPPGITLASLPGYFVLYRAERLLGLDPDDWRVLTVNAWLTTLLFVGLFSALCGPLLHRVATDLFPDSPEHARIGAALSLGLGSLVFPYATLLIDHAPVAVLSLLCFHFAQRAAAASADEPERARLRLLAAGASGGLAVLANYAAAIAVASIALYTLARRPTRRWVWLFFAGGFAPALVHFAYHQACFGSPLAIAQQFQMEIFQGEEQRLLRVFGLPEPRVLLEILFLPYRGLFYGSPVLLLSLPGLAWMWRRPELRAEAILFSAIALAFLLQNASFNAWHGGSGMGPRYLIPMLPFLALALVPIFARLPRTAAGLALVSALSMLLVTAVDPQVDLTLKRPFREFYLPLFSGESVEAGGYRYQGPVSAHPQGSAGGDIEVAAPDTRYAFWNAFNLGELLLPGSRASLLPLLIVAGGGVLALLREATRTDRNGPTGV